ncbi:hypothetical protein [Gimesia maris]|uniref:hypothetical protein n=1 Tax=Gimesia maris TaxID=122 RepID=UPI000154403F|nr:hypothetical protein [Gimesia maris]EDL56459.1 TPR repeat protein [Gimesia maris DSM 8797]
MSNQIQPDQRGLPWQLLQAVKTEWRACCLLVLLVLISFGMAINFDFVNWDDPWYVIHNPLVKSWHPENLQKVATQVVTRNYAPLTVFSFLLDHSVYGLWAGGYHLTNILLHLVNVVLVFLLITSLTKNRMLGWARRPCFLFICSVETWSDSSRKGLLSALYLASLCTAQKRSHLEQILWFLCFIGALLSKALAVVVPAIVFCYDYWVAKVPFREAVRKQVFPGCCALLLLVITMLAQTSELGGVRDHFGMSKLELISVDTVIMSKYVQMLLWPGTRSVLYDPPTSGIAWNVVISAMCWLLTALLFVRMGKRQPLILFAGATFILLLIPVLNLFPITTLMNDRYLYLPSIPFFALIFAGAMQLLERLRDRILVHVLPGKSRSGYFLPAVFGVLVLALLTRFSWQTERYLTVWRDGLTLWQYTSTQVPEIPVVQIQLANSYHSQGDSERAVNILRHALQQTKPDELDRERMQQKIREWSSVK